MPRHVTRSTERSALLQVLEEIENVRRNDLQTTQSTTKKWSQTRTSHKSSWLNQRPLDKRKTDKPTQNFSAFPTAEEELVDSAVSAIWVEFLKSHSAELAAAPRNQEPTSSKSPQKAKNSKKEWHVSQFPENYTHPVVPEKNRRKLRGTADGPKYSAQTACLAAKRPRRLWRAGDPIEGIDSIATIPEATKRPYVAKYQEPTTKAKAKGVAKQKKPNSAHYKSLRTRMQMLLQAQSQMATSENLSLSGTKRFSQSQGELQPCLSVVSATQAPANDWIPTSYMLPNSKQTMQEKDDPYACSAHSLNASSSPAAASYLRRRQQAMDPSFDTSSNLHGTQQAMLDDEDDQELEEYYEEKEKASKKDAQSQASYSSKHKIKDLLHHATSSCSSFEVPRVVDGMEPCTPIQPPSQDRKLSNTITMDEMRMTVRNMQNSPNQVDGFDEDKHHHSDDHNFDTSPCPSEDHRHLSDLQKQNLGESMQSLADALAMSGDSWSHGAMPGPYPSPVATCTQSPQPDTEPPGTQSRGSMSMGTTSTLMSAVLSPKAGLFMNSKPESIASEIEHGKIKSNIEVTTTKVVGSIRQQSLEASVGSASLSQSPSQGPQRSRSRTSLIQMSPLRLSQSKPRSNSQSKICTSPTREEKPRSRSNSQSKICTSPRREDRGKNPDSGAIDLEASWGPILPPKKSPPRGPERRTSIAGLTFMEIDTTNTSDSKHVMNRISPTRRSPTSTPPTISPTPVPSDPLQDEHFTSEMSEGPHHDPPQDQCLTSEGFRRKFTSSPNSREWMEADALERQRFQDLTMSPAIGPVGGAPSGCLASKRNELQLEFGIRAPDQDAVWDAKVKTPRAAESARTIQPSDTSRHSSVVTIITTDANVPSADDGVHIFDPNSLDDSNALVNAGMDSELKDCRKRSAKKWDLDQKGGRAVSQTAMARIMRNRYQVL